MTKKDQYQQDQYIFLQDWEFPYKEIPKEELIELLTTENPVEIDEWLDKVFQDAIKSSIHYRTFYGSRVGDILKRRNALFEKEELETLRPKYNRLTRDHLERLEKP